MHKLFPTCRQLWSERMRRFPISSWKKTQRGVVVYKRRPHFVSLRDVARFAVKCNNFNVKPEKRIQTYIELSIFIQRLITEIFSSELEDATRVILGKEVEAILKELLDILKRRGGVLWTAVWNAVKEFFNVKK